MGTPHIRPPDDVAEHATSPGAKSDVANGGLRRETDEVVRHRRQTYVLDKLLGDAPLFTKLRGQLDRVAASEATVLVVGETGTGKELLARAIHYLSARAPFPFVAVNCAALPDTLLEAELFGHERGAFTDAHASRQGLLAQAEKGTIFLDEVESLTPRGQGALLRVLQDRTFRALGSSAERSVDVRFLAATNVDLATLVRQGSFRADLLYRLRVLWLELPPLRQRRDDIPLLVRYFLRKHAVRGDRPPVVSDAASETLLRFDWPGNVRELENAVIRALHLAEDGVIERHHLGLVSATPGSSANLEKFLEEGVSFAESKRRLVHAFEREYLTRLMLTFQGNVTQAAQYAQKERRELGKLLKRHGLSAKDFAPA